MEKKILFKYLECKRGRKKDEEKMEMASK